MSQRKTRRKRGAKAVKATGPALNPNTNLDAAGIEVYLVDARHVKGVPGKKTDVCDAQWLQQLHAAGLLRKSFRPARQTVPLRHLMRHRAEMVGELARQAQLMQKVLTEMNLHIHHVFAEVDGLSAQRIISAILAGDGHRCPRPLRQRAEQGPGAHHCLLPTPHHHGSIGELQRRSQPGHLQVLRPALPRLSLPQSTPDLLLGCSAILKYTVKKW